VTSGSLPSGLTLNATTGVLSGTPSTSGTSSFTITAADSATAGLTGSRAYTLTVNPISSLAISPATLPSATVNTVSNTGTFPNNVNVPPLPAPTGTVINVSNVSQLQSAVANLQSGQTIMIAAGTYNLTAGLYIGLNSHVTNVAIRGATGNPQDVVLTGPGMDNSAVGMGVSIWNAQYVTVANVTISNVYYDAIELKGDQGADHITIYNDRLLDTGEQVIKSDPNTTGGGVTNSVVEYCTIGYTVAPSTLDHGGGTGYTQGVDVHGGSNWVVSNNFFQNFHTPDSSANLWNPTVLFWNHSMNNTVQGNAFINCDRAIAFGLNELTSGYDNQGGSIQNNFVYMAPGEYSAARIAAADAPVIAWDSPGTTIDHNTILVNGNTPNSIQVRFLETTNVFIRNNLADATVRSRDGAAYTASGNYTSATPSMFVNPGIGDLHLLSNSATQANVIGKATLLANVSTDYDGVQRHSPTDIGADEYATSTVSGSPYSVTVSATGGSGTYTFAVTSGSLPSWLSLNTNTGVLSGTPTATGTFSFTITATDSQVSGLTGSRAYTLTVNAGTSSTLTVNPATLAGATVNQAYSAALSATGGSGTYTFTVSSGSLPSWLSLNTSTGVLSGAPTISGTSSFTITATDSGTAGLTGNQVYTLTVNPAASLAVGPVTLPNATSNSAYSATVTASGGSGTYSFAATSGMPSWLTLNATTGVLSGTPTTTGSSTFSISAADSKNAGVTGSQTYTLVVNAASSLTVSPSTLPSATANSSFSATFSATGGSGTYTFAVTSGSLPSGLTLNTSTGALSGTPTTAGSSTFTITASDSKTSGLTGSHAYSLTVNPGGNVPPVTSATITTPYLTIPNFGATPTIYSVGSGNWSNPAIWSLGRVPTAGDIVDIYPGTTVTYDVNATVQLNTLEIQPTGTLTFRTDINTQVIVGNFLVLEGGSLVVGTAANPIAASVVANINLGNLPFNTATDPQQFGDGLIVLGNVTMHGATKTPYVTLAQEAHAGDAVLHLASAVNGWQVGDDPLLPDTRQITGSGQIGYIYQPQWERAIIQSISADGLTVTLTTPLKYSHLGARDVNGVLSYLPQVMNDSRNIMAQSQSMTGIRGYTLYSNRANVDIEYAGFCELGRTTNNPTGSSNVADRYAMTMLDLIGPTTPQANGYQFTLLGDEVDNDGDSNPNNPSNIQWGIALNNSYYGLIQYNDVWAVAGSGIGAEDAASSYNVFDHNFVGNVTGTSIRNDQPMGGNAFWFHNPNNYITNNIATDINGSSWDVFSYGYNIDASTGNQGGGVGTVSIAAYQGADPSVAGQSKQVNMNDTALLQFSGNQIYGATQSGMTLWWIGTYFDTPYADAGVSVVKNFVAWNFSTRGFYGYPTNNVTIDGMVARGDTSQLSNQYNYVQGINFDDYMTHNLVIQNADIQGMAVGINAPFMVGRVPTMDTTVIQNCFLDNTVNIDLSPPRSVNGSSALSPMTLDIINVRFANPSTAPQSWWYNIAMSYVTSDSLGTSNFSIPQYVYVTNYNGIQGDNFQVFYNQNHPANATQMPEILGYTL
jgi:hypothetical protein